MRVHIKSIDVWSAAKVGCGMAALPVVCLLSVFMLSWVDPVIARQVNLPPLFPLGVLLYALMVGVIPAIGWALLAIIYNVVAMFTGGVVLQLRREVTEDVEQRRSESQAINESNSSVKAWQQVRESDPPPIVNRSKFSAKEIGQPGVGLSTWYELTQEERELIRKRRG